MILVKSTLLTDAHPIVLGDRREAFPPGRQIAAAVVGFRQQKADGALGRVYSTIISSHSEHPPAGGWAWTDFAFTQEYLTNFGNQVHEFCKGRLNLKEPPHLIWGGDFNSPVRTNGGRVTWGPDKRQIRKVNTDSSGVTTKHQNKFDWVLQTKSDFGVLNPQQSNPRATGHPNASDHYVMKYILSGPMMDVSC